MNIFCKMNRIWKGYHLKHILTWGFRAKCVLLDLLTILLPLIWRPQATAFFSGLIKRRWPSNPLNKFLIVQCSLLLFRIIGYLFYYTRAIGNVLYILILTNFEVQYAFCQTWTLLPEVVRPKSIVCLERVRQMHFVRETKPVDKYSV